jgi:hypothetical protein
LLPGNLKLTDPKVRDLLKMKAVAKVPDATGQTVYDLTGEQVASIPDFVATYVRDRELKPTSDITHSIVGRPECVDFISEFIVPESVAVAVPVPQVFGQPSVVAPTPTQVPQPQQTPVPGFQPQPTQTQGPGFQPPPGFTPFQPQAGQFQQTQGPGFQPPPGFTPFQPQAGQFQQPTGPGFQPPPAFVSMPVAPLGQMSQQPSVALTSDMIARLKDYLLVQRAKKCKSLSRLDAAVQRLAEHKADNFQRNAGKYLNLSTCQYAVAKNFQKQTVGAIPGTNQPFNLALKNEDLSNILVGEGKNVLNEPKWDPYIAEVFRRIAEEMTGRIGSTTQKAEESLMAVPLSVLDTIPTGPSPVGRAVAAAKTPFIEAVPLSGVIEVTVPITDGKRCIPGLMAKKRD